MLAQRRPDEQVYVGPTSVSNVGHTESTTEKLRWPNVVMLSGILSHYYRHLTGSNDILYIRQYRFKENLIEIVFWMSRNRYFAQKEGLRKEGCFSRNEDFHTKGTFYHITTGA